MQKGGDLLRAPADDERRHLRAVLPMGRSARGLGQCSKEGCLARRSTGRLWPLPFGFNRRTTTAGGGGVDSCERHRLKGRGWIASVVAARTPLQNCFSAAELSPRCLVSTEEELDSSSAVASPADAALEDRASSPSALPPAAETEWVAVHDSAMFMIVRISNDVGVGILARPKESMMAVRSRDLSSTTCVK